LYTRKQKDEDKEVSNEENSNNAFHLLSRVKNLVKTSLQPSFNQSGYDAFGRNNFSLVV
jgi:hypothetical protein